MEKPHLLLNKFPRIKFIFRQPETRNLRRQRMSRSYNVAPPRSKQQAASQQQAYQRQLALDRDIRSMSRRTTYVPPTSAGAILPDWKYRKINYEREKKIQSDILKDKMSAAHPKQTADWLVPKPFGTGMCTEAEALLSIEQHKIDLAEERNRLYLEERWDYDNYQRALTKRKQEARERLAATLARKEPNVYQKMAIQQRIAKRIAIQKNLNVQPKIRPKLLTGVKKPALTRKIKKDWNPPMVARNPFSTNR